MSTSAVARPESTRPFLRAQWRSLAMLNYEIDPAVLRPFVPAGTELDTWQGKHFVSVVGFMFLDTRLGRVAVPLHTNFPEVNLRFYVLRRVRNKWRRGVTFLREIVPRRAIATVANTLYNERYITLPMRHTVDLQEEGGCVEYSWRYKQRWNHLSLRTQGEWQEIAADSPEEFITEHYWGYASRRDGGCMEYRVEHPRWRARQVSQASFDCDVASLYGPQYVPFLQGEPASAFVANGSEVTVFRGTRL